MTDPRRLRDDPAARDTHDALASLGSPEPPQGVEDRVWATVLAGLPALGAPSDGGGVTGPPAAGGSGLEGAGAAAGLAKIAAASAPIKSGATLLAGKIMLGASLGLATLAVGALGMRLAPEPARPPVLSVPAAASVLPPLRPFPAASVEATVATAESAAAPSRPEPVRAGTVSSLRPATEAAPDLPESAGAPLPPATVVMTPPPTSGPLPTALAEETRRVAEARAAVRAGEGDRALRLLAALAADHPRGVLGQERELLTIDALVVSGRSAEARSRAKAFLETHPGSAHAARLGGIAGAP